MTRKTKKSRTGTYLLDDRWLNQVQALLDDAARASQRDRGRKPALEDLRRLLATVLGAGGLDRWFADGAERIVSDVAFKVATRRPPKHASVGDVLAIAVGKKRFGFARVMHDPGLPFIGVFIEVFRHRDEGQPYRPWSQYARVPSRSV